MINRQSFRRRLQTRRSSEAGLTLIELLISLTLLSVIAVFLAEGVGWSQRGFSADRIAADAAERAADLDALASLISAALPIPVSHEISQLDFEGGGDQLTFSALSLGHALPGGPVRLKIARNGGLLEVVVLGRNGSSTSAPVRNVAVRGAVSVRFSYFGRAVPNKAAAWQSEWLKSDHLPDLVAMTVEFANPRSNRPPIVVALRQG